MNSKTDKDRISYLEKRVAELQKELADAKSPGIFCKVLVTLILAGIGFFIWKSRNIIKWSIIALICWWAFGDSVCSIYESTCKSISAFRAEWKADSKINAEHKRVLERMRVEAETDNSRVKAEADAHVKTVTADADAKTQVLKTEDAIKQAEWERGQAERRNDAVNDAIRNGHWHSNTPAVKPEVATPVSPEISKPQTKPTVTVNSENKEPKIERTVDGNTTRVIVRF